MRALRTLLAAFSLAIIPPVAEAQSTPAKSDTARVDVTGKWAFNIESPFRGTPTVTFTQKGDSISGKYASNALGNRDFVGTMKAGKIAFSFGAESGGQNFTMSFAGKLDDPDTMSGAIDFSGMATGAFSAKRVKP